MGIHPETAISDFWNTDPDKGPLHDRLRASILLEPRQLPGALTGVTLEADISIGSIAKDHEQP